MASSKEKSIGHILFDVQGEYASQQFEYFMRNDNLLCAPLDNVIMPDGYRSGRFVCSAFYADRQLAAMGLLLANRNGLQGDTP